MSHYVKAAVKVKHRGGLVAALRELGFSPYVYDEPVHLRGYHDDLRPEVAHVVIPRAQVGGASNDIGFLERADGSWEAIVSQYDGRRHGVNWQGRVAHLAGVHADLLTAQDLGLTAERVDNADGSVDVYVYANE